MSYRSPESWNCFLNFNSGNTFFNPCLTAPQWFSTMGSLYFKHNNKSNVIIANYETPFLPNLSHHIKAVGGLEFSHPHKCYTESTLSLFLSQTRCALGNTSITTHSHVDYDRWKIESDFWDEVILSHVFFTVTTTLVHIKVMCSHHF
jgi:hypothetical protein